MKSDFLLTPILADEVSTGGVIVGSGVASTLLLFFGETATVMLPFFCVALVVILVDLIFGIRAAKARGEAIRISRALRRTLGKTVEYTCWLILASSLSVATGIPILATALVLVVIGIELISIAQNWYFAWLWPKHGWTVNQVCLTSFLVMFYSFALSWGLSVLGRMKGGAMRLAKHTNRLAVLGCLAFFDIIVCLICMFL